MNLTHDLTEAVDEIEGRKCKTCDLLAALPDDERGALQRALRSKIGAEKLIRILQKNGHDIGRPSVITHRNEAHA